MIYQEFAEFYDQLFDEGMYHKWASFVENNVNKSASIMDLACGTGRLLSLLLKAGYNHVSGLDLSSDMLTLADSRLNMHEVTLIQGNLMDLDGIPNYDTITCFDDSLCYLSNEEELLAALLNMNHHLNDHGQLLFDVITPYQTDIVYPGYMYNYHDDENAFMWQSYIGDYPHSVEHDLVFFKYNHQLNAYDEFSETHKERTYTLEVYKRLLSTAGFTNIKVSANFGKENINSQTTRWFFICTKG